MIERGIFVGIEGGDGSGKGTQAKELEARRTAAGRTVLRLSFPQYDKPSSRFAQKYLNGLYGGVNDVHPDLASLTYAIDRYAAKDMIHEAIDQGKDVVLDRYVASNMAHQAAKIHDPAERRLFYEQIIELEYGILGLPQPQKNIVLLVPPAISQENVDKKEARTYTDMKRDIHEADPLHLEYAKRNYEELCELYPELFTPVDCIDKEGKMRSIESIRKEIETITDGLSANR